MVSHPHPLKASALSLPLCVCLSDSQPHGLSVCLSRCLSVCLSASTLNLPVSVCLCLSPPPPTLYLSLRKRFRKYNSTIRESDGRSALQGVSASTRQFTDLHSNHHCLRDSAVEDRRDSDGRGARAQLLACNYVTLEPLHRGEHQRDSRQIKHDLSVGVMITVVRALLIKESLRGYIIFVQWMTSLLW